MIYFEASTSNVYSAFVSSFTLLVFLPQVQAKKASRFNEGYQQQQFFFRL
jgi:hypothetical protein